MTLLWIPFLILIPLGIVWLFYTDRMCDTPQPHRARSKDRQDRAKQVLSIARRRLERGEITPEQYADIRRTFG